MPQLGTYLSHSNRFSSEMDDISNANFIDQNAIEQRICVSLCLSDNQRSKKELIQI